MPVVAQVIDVAHGPVVFFSMKSTHTLRRGFIYYTRHLMVERGSRNYKKKIDKFSVKFDLLSFACF